MLKTNFKEILALAALTVALVLGGCVSGGGAPEAPPALQVLPGADTVLLPGIPTAFTITGGVMNYSVFSSNTAAISLASSAVAGSTFTINANNVTADTPVTLTVTDAANTKVEIKVTVKSTTTGPLAVVPAVSTGYNGNPIVFAITGGVKKYSVYSNNTAIISFDSNLVSENTFIVNPSNVAADTPVTLTVIDAANTSVQTTVTVKPASLGYSSLTVTPDASTINCLPAICNGGTGLVGIKLLPSGNLSNHNVQLEVVQGDFGFSSGAATVNSLTVSTDATGSAFAAIKASASATTQYAILKATDLSNGSFQQTTFVIAQGAGVLSVVPSTATFSSPTTLNGTCPAGIRSNYYVFGGLPPYRIASSSTDVATVSPARVSNIGDGFTATTVGAVCGDVNFVITDSTGRTTTAKLTNTVGTYVPVVTPVVAPDLVISPASASGIIGQTLTFVVAGGTPGYSVSSNNPAIASVTSVSSSGGQSIFTASLKSAGAVTLTVGDFAGKTITAVLTVTGTSGGGGALTVSPANGSGTVGQDLTFVLTGGSPGYSVISSNTNIATASIVLSGGQNTVKATLVGAGSVPLIVSDSAGNTTTINLTVTGTSGGGGALTASPSSATGTVGDTLNFLISGGTAPYTAISNNTSIATTPPGAISGSTLTVNLVKASLIPATFIITDKNNNQVSVSVTVNSVTSGFRLSPSVVAVAGGLAGFNLGITYTITGGTAPYTALSSDLSLATVSAVTPNTTGAVNTFTVTGVRKAITASADVTITVIDNNGSTATATYTAKLPAP